MLVKIAMQNNNSEDEQELSTELAVYHKILIFWLRDWRSANCFLWLDCYVSQRLQGELLLSNSILQQYTACLQTPWVGDCASLAALSACCTKTAFHTHLLWEEDKETHHPTSFLLKNLRFTMEMMSHFTTFAYNFKFERFHERGFSNIVMCIQNKSVPRIFSKRIKIQAKGVRDSFSNFMFTVFFWRKRRGWEGGRVGQKSKKKPKTTVLSELE